MLTLVPGQGENPSPKSKHRGDFMDFLQWFSGAPQKCTFHHCVAGAALGPFFRSDWCSRHDTNSGYNPFPEVPAVPAQAPAVSVLKNV